MVEGREVREAGVGKGVRRRLAVKPKVTIYSMGLLSLGACTNTRSGAMQDLPKILYERKRSHRPFDEGMNGDRAANNVKDALVAVHRMNAGGCNVVLDCLDFWETWEHLQHDDDVKNKHCGTHPQNVRRLLKHREGGRTIESWSKKYAGKVDALRPQLREELQKYAYGGSQDPPHLFLCCVCKSGRDRSVGMATVLQCLLSWESHWSIVVEHLCQSDWRNNLGCKRDIGCTKEHRCRQCLQPNNSINDVIAATEEVEYLKLKYWSPGLRK